MLLYRALLFVFIFISPVLSSMAPFSTDDIVNHAAPEAKGYLNSTPGQKAIFAIISRINRDQWPERYNFKENYNKANPTDDHNKALIAQYVFRDSQKENLSKTIVQKLQEQGTISPEAKTKTKEITRSSFTDHIIFIKDKSTCPLVAKVFKFSEDFVKENNQMKIEDAYIEVINELRVTCNYPLPIITRRQGDIVVENVGVILMEKAKGKPLSEIFQTLESLDDHKIKEIFNNVGAQFGALDNLMYTNKNEVLFHSDGHLGNFVYDEKKNQLYWIDIAGLLLLKRASELPDLKLFQNLNTVNLTFLPVSKKIHEDFKKSLVELENKPTLPTNVKEMLSKLTVYAIESNFRTLDVLKSLPSEDKTLVINTLQPSISLLKKRVLALKSFGEGYSQKNPIGKDIYNENVKKLQNDETESKTIQFYINLIHAIEEAVDHPQTSFEDIEIQ